jgi:hypothetical protein
MSGLSGEIDSNFEKFFQSWTKSAENNWTTLHKNAKFKESYQRLSALQAVKSDLVVPQLSAGSAAFFLEAHNDALTSHVNASLGAWRSALQNLRSCLENTLAALYFKDHPVELQLWEHGKYRSTFSELYSYAKGHPEIDGIAAELCGLDIVKAEYATLSKAVHGSAVNFRMTDDASEILLWSTEAPALGRWADREKQVVLAICLLWVAFFRSELTGTKKSGLREVLSLVIPKTKRQAIKGAFKVTIAG